MSFEAAAWAINQQTRSQTAKLVLIALSNCHNRDTGQCNPGNAYLMTVAQCGARAVNYAIAELEEMGLIQAERERGKRTNYRLLLARSSALSAPVKRKSSADSALLWAPKSSALNALLDADDEENAVQTDTKSSALNALAHSVRQRTKCGGVAHSVRGSSALCDNPFSIESVKNQEGTYQQQHQQRVCAGDVESSPQPVEAAHPNTVKPGTPDWLRDDLDASLAKSAAANPGADPDPAFRMADTWTPSPKLAERCQASGIPPELDPGLLVEFRSYWSAESTALRHNQWEHKLLRQMLYAHRNQQTQSAPTPGGSHATGRYPRAASAADIDFADTSWLDEQTIERCRSAVGQRGV
ncbi:MAG: DnaT-like ssDNA-binding domain-containing protein [Hyphomicrobiaceae bacterium]